MLRITVGTTLESSPAKVKSAETTVREMLAEYQEETGFDISTGSWAINGTPLRHEEYDKSFSALGYTDGNIYLMNIVNAKNA